MDNAQRSSVTRRPENKFEDVLVLPEGEVQRDVGGLRTQGYFKANLTDKPLITVVTVVYNGEQFIEETIKSVLNQTYDNVEYIIIDGGSTDGTMNIIREYSKYIDYWISEKDKGIYDAMNKGIELATGEWINFMNSGDTFNSSDILMMIFHGSKYDEEILFGNVHIRYPDFSRIARARNIRHLWQGMQFCHQSAFVRTAIHKLNLFNADNLIAADLQFYYESYKSNIKFRHVEHIIASVRTGGLSESNRNRTIRASRDAICITDCTLAIRLFYIFRIIDALIRNWLKLILPKKIINAIIRNKQ